MGGRNEIRLEQPLLDTLRFDDAREAGYEILVDVESFLSEAYGRDRLSGSIYLHHITDLRFFVRGSPRLQLPWPLSVL